jgi:hypothetical protein
MRKGTRKNEREKQKLRERNWLLQARLDFFEERNGHRGSTFAAECYWACNQSKFNLFLRKKTDALITKYREKIQSRKTAKAAAVGAKMLLKEQSVACAADVAFTAKSQTALKVVGPRVELPERTQEQHEQLRKERRERNHGKKAAAIVLRQANIVASVVFLKHVMDVAIRRVVQRVDIHASEVLNESENIRICALKSKGISLPSKSMPRRKRSARKSGSSI